MAITYLVNLDFEEGPPLTDLLPVADPLNPFTTPWDCEVVSGAGRDSTYGVRQSEVPADLVLCYYWFGYADYELAKYVTDVVLEPGEAWGCQVDIKLSAAALSTDEYGIQFLGIQTIDNEGLESNPCELHLESTAYGSTEEPTFKLMNYFNSETPSWSGSLGTTAELTDTWHTFKIRGWNGTAVDAADGYIEFSVDGVIIYEGTEKVWARNLLIAGLYVGAYTSPGDADNWKVWRGEEEATPVDPLRNCRASVIGFGLESLVVLPYPTGDALDQADRQHLKFSYRCILANTLIRRILAFLVKRCPHLYEARRDDHHYEGAPGRCWTFGIAGLLSSTPSIGAGGATTTPLAYWVLDVSALNTGTRLA